VLELQPQYLRIFHTFSVHYFYFKNYCHVCMHLYLYSMFIIWYCTRRVQFSLVGNQWGSAMGWTSRIWKLAIARDYLFPKISRWALWPTQPSIQWVQWAVSPELKWPGYEGAHLPPSIARWRRVELYVSSSRIPLWHV
jgi:hypothetical protein